MILILIFCFNYFSDFYFYFHYFLASQNNRQSILSNSIQSDNFTRNNHLNYLILYPESDYLNYNNNANYDNNNNTIPTLTTPTNGRNISTNSIQDQSNNFTSKEDTRARPIYLSRSIILDDPELDHLINDNTENYDNNDNTQCLDDLDELGLGVTLEIRVEDMDFFST